MKGRFVRVTLRLLLTKQSYEKAVNENRIFRDLEGAKKSPTLKEKVLRDFRTVNRIKARAIF